MDDRKPRICPHTEKKLKEMGGRLGQDIDYLIVVTAKLENLTNKETVALLENVALGEVAFKDLKKGDYLLTITWVDGVSNSITMNISL